MKSASYAFLVALMTLTGCATWRPTVHNSQEITWGALRMSVPKDWTLKTTEDSLLAESPTSSESLSVSEFEPAPHFLAANPSPQRIIDREVELLSPPDPKSSEEYTISRHRKFNLPCGEPASVVLQGLGENLFVATYAIASNRKMYRIHFYKTGEITRGNRGYRNMIKTARVAGFLSSSCSLAPR